MSQPGLNNVHVNRPLTNISAAVWQEDRAFAFNRVFPTLPVQHKSDDFYKFRLADALRDDMRPRAPGTESAGSGFHYDIETYSVKVYSLHHDIDDQIRANTDSPLDQDVDTTRWLTQQAMINQEKLFASSFLTAGIWGVDFTGVASAPTANQVLKWTDAASDPVADVSKAKTRVQLLGGLRPNVIVMSQDVRDALDTNPSIIERIKFSGGIGNNTPVVVNDNALAQVFGVEEIVISSAIAATSAEGAPTLVNDFITRGKVLLAYRARTAGVNVPTAGYRFTWAGYTNNQGVEVRKFRVETLRSDRIEVDVATDQKLVYKEAAALFSELV